MALLLMLKKIWDYKGLIAIGLVGVLVVVLWNYSGNMRAQRDKFKTERDAAQAQYVYYKEQAELALDTISKLQQKNIDLLKTAKQREREIRNVPKDQDGPVAPVLRGSLDRMR